MAQIDTYRSAFFRKKQELAKLSQDLAKEQAKLASLQSKITSASNAISRTKSASTIKTKKAEIERCQKAIVDNQKKIGEIQKKIANKEKELSVAEKRYHDEDAKLRKKQAAEDKKELKAAERHAQQLEQRVRENERRQEQMRQDIEQLQTIPEVITVLFLAANPVGIGSLQLDEEARAIQEKIRMSEYRDSVRFETRWATRAVDILQAINETNPTIIHFSGHGASTGELVLLNTDGSPKLVSKEAISAAIATASDTIRLVVFNTCFSEIQAQNIVKHIESAIGMTTSISDGAARVFAAQLYSSIGFGHSIQVAFNQAVALLMLEGIAEEDTPKLYVKDETDPNDLILVQA